MNNLLNDSVIFYFLTILRALSTKAFLLLFEALVLYNEDRDRAFQTQRNHRSFALTVALETGLSRRPPTSYLLIQSTGNSSSLWSLFKTFLFMYFTPSQLISDLPLVSFDWQKGLRSHWNLILERIGVLCLWVHQCLFGDQRLSVGRLVDTCDLQLGLLWQIYNPWAIWNF